MEDRVGMFHVRCYDSVSSTNNIVGKAIDEGAQEGLAIAALTQTAGYGRQGRNWKSPEGGMYVSVLLRPHAALSVLPTLSLVVALAVKRTVLEYPIFLPSSVKVKWPNDVVVEKTDAADPVAFVANDHAISVGERREEKEALNGADTTSHPIFHKLCGISLERRKDAICVGVGINVFKPEASYPLEGKNEPAYLNELIDCYKRGVGRSLSISLVRHAFLTHLSDMYAIWLKEGFQAFIDEYRDCSCLLGRRIVVSDMNGGHTAEGTVLDIDGSGRLVLSTDEGERMEIASGEAHIESCS